MDFIVAITASAGRYIVTPSHEKNEGSSVLNPAFGSWFPNVSFSKSIAANLTDFGYGNTLCIKSLPLPCLRGRMVNFEYP